MKLSNVFLDLPTAASYPSYVTPLLADYGHAVRSDDNDSFNPRFYRKDGTEDFFAPEQLEHVDRTDFAIIDDFKLSEQTNVYGMGLILWQVAPGMTAV